MIVTKALTNKITSFMLQWQVKSIYSTVPVNYGMLPQANATRRLFPALSKRKSPDTSFEGENEDYSVRTKTGTSLRSNRRAPKPFSRIVS